MCKNKEHNFHSKYTIIAIDWMTRTTFATGDYDGTIKFWEVGKEQPVKTMKEHTSRVK